MASNKPIDPDSPKVFNLNAVKVEASKFPPFPFSWGPKGERWELKHRELLNQLPLLQAAEDNGNIGGTLETFRSALGAEQWERFRKIPINDTQIQALMDAYAEHCGVDTGESQGSTGS